MSPLDVLDKVEQLMHEHGWQRTSLQHCMLGRAYEAVGAQFGHMRETSNPTLHKALNAVREHLGAYRLSLWNSESTRTFEEVLAALAGGRALLRKQAT